MTKVLLFNTNKEAKLITVPHTKDGAIIIGDKKFYVNDEESDFLLLQKRFGYEPLYLLKWDCILPGKVKFEEKDVEMSEKLNELKSNISGRPVVKRYISTVTFTRDAKNTPESLYKTETLKILGGMLKVKREVKHFAPLIFGLIMGIMITFIMFYLKLLRV
jgi:hypothetical protein